MKERDGDDGIMPCAGDVTLMSPEAVREQDWDNIVTCHQGCTFCFPPNEACNGSNVADDSLTLCAEDKRKHQNGG